MAIWRKIMVSFNICFNICSLLHILQKMILIMRDRGDININKNFGQFDSSKIKADTFKDTAKLKKSQK